MSGDSASIDRAKRARQRLDVRRPQIEPIGGLRQAELVDEDLRELVVPVLARMDDDLVDPGLAQGDGERRRLDELRPVADDGEDSHPRSVRPRRADERPDAFRATARAGT